MEYRFDNSLDTIEITEVNASYQTDSLQYINQALNSIGLQPITTPQGDKDFTKSTLNTIQFVLQSLYKERYAKTELYEQLQRKDSENKSQSIVIERLKDEKEDIRSDLERTRLMIRHKEAEQKAIQDKITNERDELKREISKMVHKEVQMQHELKKKDSELARLKDQLRKKYGESNFTVKNSIVLTEPLHQNKGMIFEYDNLRESGMISGMYDSYQKIQADNRLYAQMMIEFHKELQTIYDNLVTFDLDLEEGARFIVVREDMLKLPISEISRQLQQMTQSNISVIKKYLEHINNRVINNAPATKYDRFWQNTVNRFEDLVKRQNKLIKQRNISISPKDTVVSHKESSEFDLEVQFEAIEETSCE